MISGSLRKLSTVAETARGHFAPQSYTEVDRQPTSRGERDDAVQCVFRGIGVVFCARLR